LEARDNKVSGTLMGSLPVTQAKGAVLVVDDDEEIIRDTLQRVMEQEGHEVVTAASGQEALVKASLQEFEVVLLDVMMPGLSGMDLLQKLHMEHPDTSVIMVTAVADVQTVIQAMKAGAYDYVFKPFNLEDVVLKVEKALERRQLVLQNKRYRYRLEERVAEQRVRLQKQFVELIQSLAREHAVLYEMETSRRRRGRRTVPLQELPLELQKPMNSVQEFAAALLRIMQERGISPDGMEKRA